MSAGESRGLDYLCQQITNLEERMDQQIDPRAFGQLEATVKAQNDRIDQLAKDIEVLSKKVGDLVTIMSETKGGWKALVWVSGVAAALGSGITWVVQHVTLK